MRSQAPRYASRARRVIRPGCPPGHTRHSAPQMVEPLVIGAAASGKSYGRTSASRGYSRAVSSWPHSSTMRRSRTASAMGLEAPGATRPQIVSILRETPTTTVSRSMSCSGVIR